MDETALAKLRIFLGMDEQERQQLLALTHPVEIDSGEVIIPQGRIIQNLWFILEGRCEVSCQTESGCRLKLAELEPYRVLGEMSFFHAAGNAGREPVAMTILSARTVTRSPTCNV